MKRRGHAAIEVALAAFIPACSSDFERPPIIWEGENVRFGTDRDLDTVCGGTLSSLDSVVGHLGNVLAVPSPEVDFYWVPDDFSDYCPSTSLGCGADGEVYSRYPFHQHEIVHAVRQERAVLPFEEGLAEALGDDWDPAFPMMGDVVDMYVMHESSESMKGTWYPLAGLFVAYLRDEYGDDALVEFDLASARGDEIEATNSKLNQTYGLDLEGAAQEQSVVYGTCDQRFYRDDSFECNQEAMVLPVGLDEIAELSVSLDCDEIDVLGPRRGERWRTITFEVVESSIYNVSIEKIGGAAPGRVRLLGCGLGCDGDTPAAGLRIIETVEPVSEPSLMPQLYGGCANPGRYTLRLAVDEDDEGYFLVRFQRFGDIACET